MIPFFNTPARLAALNAEARSWLGTPFAAHAMVKGAGADCVHLVAGIYLATGALDTFKAPPYALDEGTELLIKWLTTDSRFARIPSPAGAGEGGRRPGEGCWANPGDILCFHFRMPGFHAGLMLECGDFIHVLPKREAIISNLRESFYSRRIVAVFRPVIPSPAGAGEGPGEGCKGGVS